jgi:transposase
MKAAQAAAILARIRPGDPVADERKALARDLVAEIRRVDRDLAELGARITTAVTASGTTVTDIFGVGPVVAAYLIGHSGDIARFPTAGHYARYNGTAPIEASSGPTRRHRLNPRGNRQLNHALHMAAVTQVRNDTPAGPTTSASRPRGSPRRTPCAPSSAGCPTPSTASSSPTTTAEHGGSGRTTGNDSMASVTGSAP